MRNIVGQAVIGDDLYGRDVELARLWETLRQGEHIHMLAPRRVGKTSLMLELRRKPPTNWHVVYVDVQGVSGPADWIAAVMSELAVSPTYRTWLEAVPFGKSLADVWQGLGNAQVASPFLRVELRSAMGNEWPDAMDRLQARLAKLPEADAHLLIIVDELPVLLARMLRKERGRDEAELLLAKLRSWRQSPQLRGKVHTLVGGSVGLDGVLRREGLSSLINDLVPFRIDSWERETAVDFVKRLGRDRQFRLKDDHIELMLDLLMDPVPYHVQLFFRELVRAVKGNVLDLTVNHVNECFVDRLTGPGGTPHLDHYGTRLEVALDAVRYEVADAVLNRACSSPDGASVCEIEAAAGSSAEMLPTVLNELEFDGYIVRSGRRIGFRSGLLRTWWRKNRVGSIS
jgi:hypothetical protein